MFGIKKKRQVGIIINPFAAANKSDPGQSLRNIERLSGHLKPAIWLTNRLDDIYQVAEEFRSEGLRYLVISGGNGSFHHVISRFKTVYKDVDVPPVLLLRAGHMNTIADTINNKGSDQEIFRRMTKALQSGSLTLLKRNLIKIEDRYCTIFGAGGVVSRFMDIYYGMGDYSPEKAVEVITNILTVIRRPSSPEFRKLFASFNAVVTIDGKQWHKKRTMGCLGLTIPGIGLGFMPGSKTLNAGGRFQFICSGLTPMDFATQIFRFYAGIPFNDPDHFDDLVENVHIESRDPFGYTMDGEMYDAIYELDITSSGRGVYFMCM